MSETGQYRSRRDASVRNPCVPSENERQYQKPDGSVVEQTGFSEARSTRSPLQEDIVRLRSLASVFGRFLVTWDTGELEVRAARGAIRAHLALASVRLQNARKYAYSAGYKTGVSVRNQMETDDVVLK